jgi:hypothetical protein
MLNQKDRGPSLASCGGAEEELARPEVAFRLFVPTALSGIVLNHDLLEMRQPPLSSNAGFDPEPPAPPPPEERSFTPNHTNSL